MHGYLQQRPRVPAGRVGPGHSNAPLVLHRGGEPQQADPDIHVAAVAEVRAAGGEEAVEELDTARHSTGTAQAHHSHSTATAQPPHSHSHRAL